MRSVLSGDGALEKTKAGARGGVLWFNQDRQERPHRESGV